MCSSAIREERESTANQLAFPDMTIISKGSYMSNHFLDAANDTPVARFQNVKEGILGNLLAYAKSGIKHRAVMGEIHVDRLIPQKQPHDEFRI